MSDVPLVFTTKGNVPVDSLVYVQEWQVTEDYVVFIETYTDAAEEIVRRNVHVRALKAMPALGADQAAIA